MRQFGHIVSITGVNEDAIEVLSELEYKTGYSWDNIENEFYNVIDKYFDELNHNWANEKEIVVRVSQIETRILNITGVLDVRNTKINGQEANYVLNKDSIAIRKENQYDEENNVQKH